MECAPYHVLEQQPRIQVLTSSPVRYYWTIEQTIIPKFLPANKHFKVFEVIEHEIVMCDIGKSYVVCSIRISTELLN